MPTAYKTAGQDNPGASLTTLYTVPASTEFVGKFVVANRAAVTKEFRMAIRIGGAAIADDMYWFYDWIIPAQDSLTVEGISMAATDKLDVYGEDANVSFNLNGVEIT